MRMFDLEVYKFLIIGIICVSYILYLFTSSIVLCICTAVAIFGAHSAQRQQPSALGLNSQQNHAPGVRRRIVSSAGKNTSRDSFHNATRQMTAITPTTPWGISKSNYLTASSSVRISPISSLQNASRNTSRTSCGFASQVVSTAYNHNNYPPIDQSHYRGLGLFPIIHLQKSPLPILSGKNSHMVYNPVTVRIAPPEKTPMPSPRADFIFNSKVQTTPTSSVNSVLKSLQQIHRKRSFYNMAEESDESQMKRQRCESSPIRESVFKSLSASTDDINDIQLSSPASTSVHLAGVSRETTPINSDLIQSPRVKNNEIFSSYSSVNRSRERMKRRRPERSGSPSITISKLRNTKNTVFNNSSSDRRRSNSERDETFETVMPETQLQDLNDDEPFPSKMPKLSKSPVAWREGYSKKRELSLYKSLRQKNLLPQYVPQANSSVEDNNRDQLINQARLHKLLTAFQAKDCDSNGNRNSSLFNSRPLQVSLSETTNISRSPASSPGLLTIVTMPISEPVTKSTSDSWVPRVDVTTTTSSLTILSSTGSDKQEVEKIHVQSNASPSATSALSNPSVVSTAIITQPQLNVTSTEVPAVLGNISVAAPAATVNPLITSTFVSMPLTSGTPSFNPLGTSIFSTTPIAVNLSSQTPITQNSSPFSSSLLAPVATKIPSTASVSTSTSNTFVFGETATSKTQLSATPSIFGQQTQSTNLSNKVESRNIIQPFQFNATPQTVASQPVGFNLNATPQQSFNNIFNTTGNSLAPTSTTTTANTGGFHFNINSVTNSAPSTPAFPVNTCFSQPASNTNVFNTSNSTGVFNFAASPQTTNGPLATSSFNSGTVVTSSGPAPGSELASQFTFGQSGGFSFNFAAEPSSVGVTNRKSIQARRRTSRQH